MSADPPHSVPIINIPVSDKLLCISLELISGRDLWVVCVIRIQTKHIQQQQRQHKHQDQTKLQSKTS